MSFWFVEATKMGIHLFSAKGELDHGIRTQKLPKANQMS